jgi:uncharacterized protein YjbI with pentapeptide repeats
LVRVAAASGLASGTSRKRRIAGAAAIVSAGLLAVSAATIASPAGAAATTTVKRCVVVLKPTWAHHTTCSGSYRDGDFARLDLRFARFAGANLSGANFDGADLTGARFYKSRLDGAHFVGANLTIAFLNPKSAVRAAFRNAILADAILARTSGAAPNDFNHSDFRNALLIQAHGTADASWVGVDFTDADLAGSDFTPARLAKAILNNTVCPNASTSTNGRCR